MIKIEVTPQYGRGVYATKDIPRGTIIEFCEVLPLSFHDTSIIQMTDLQFYTFKYNDEQDCLVMGYGEMYNHADTPNVSYKLVPIESRKLMVFTALTDIKAGEQLFINYTADTAVNPDQYKVNLI